MAARTKARKRALDVLFQADISGEDILTVFALTAARSDGPLNPYTEQLVAGVATHQAQLDSLISQCSHDWTLARMPIVDRNLLRIATFELLYESDVPSGVAISEAVELAKDLSTDESSRFVNGVLSQIARTAPRAGSETSTEPAPEVT